MKTALIYFLLAFSVLQPAVASTSILDYNDTLYASAVPFSGLSNNDTIIVRGHFVMNADYDLYDSTSIHLIVDSGEIHWTGDNQLTIGVGSSLLFINGGNLTAVSPCNNNKTIYFGTTEIAACTGGPAGVYNFNDIVDSGGIDTTGTVLSVHWLSFEIINAGHELEIHWSTALERNNSHFELYNSENGVDWNIFSYVHSKAPNGNSTSILTYTQPHAPPDLSQNHYYRIKQYDFDGNYDWSQILIYQANNNDKPALTYIGNGLVKLNTLPRAWKQSKLEIINIHGTKVFSGDAVSFTDFKLTPSFYIFTFSRYDENFSIRFIVH